LLLFCSSGPPSATFGRGPEGFPLGCHSESSRRKASLPRRSCATVRLRSEARCSRPGWGCGESLRRLCCFARVRASWRVAQPSRPSRFFGCPVLAVRRGQGFLLPVIIAGRLADSRIGRWGCARASSSGQASPRPSPRPSFENPAPIRNTSLPPHSKQVLSNKVIAKRSFLCYYVL